jgi:hypothetical protein
MSVPQSMCTRAAATSYVRAQLAQAGWKLLAVVSVSN